MLISVNYSFKYFKELTGNELYNIYYLRCMVFVVEQQCAYQEVDEHDLTALHLLVQKNDALIAYARILPPDNKYQLPRIGRVVVHPDVRGQKTGHLLMKAAITKCSTEFQGQDVLISAQNHLQAFYTELGFRTEGEVYLEDNIPHIAMRFINTSNQIA